MESINSPTSTTWSDEDILRLSKFVEDNPVLKKVETKNNKKARRTGLEQLQKIMSSTFTGTETVIVNDNK